MKLLVRLARERQLTASADGVAVLVSGLDRVVLAAKTAFHIRWVRWLEGVVLFSRHSRYCKRTSGPEGSVSREMNDRLDMMRLREHIKSGNRIKNIAVRSEFLEVASESRRIT